MVGIVGILLLGSLFWSALGALFGAFGTATQAVPTARPAPVLVVTVVPGTPGPVATPTAQLAARTPTPQSTAEPTPQPQPTATALPQSDARAPWILLPQPAPGTRVSPGQVTIEARGRGDAPISGMRLELDGSALPVTLEQRSEDTWRATASARLGVGQHAVRAVVVDKNGKSGSFRWSFETAAP